MVDTVGRPVAVQEQLLEGREIVDLREVRYGFSFVFF